MIFYKETGFIVLSLEGDTDSFDIVTWVWVVDTWCTQ